MSSKRIILLILIISSLIILISFGLRIFNRDLLTKFIQPSDSRKNEIAQTDRTVELPIDINHPSVVAATLNYIFEGTIEDLKNGVEIVLDNQVEGMPRFFVTPETEIYYLLDPLHTKKTDSTALKLSLKVRIVTIYGLKVNRWTISRINILVSSLPESPPSQSSK